MSDELLSEVQMAKLLGIEVVTLRNRVCRGLAPPSFGRGAQRRFPMDEFRRWTKAQIAKNMKPVRSSRNRVA